MRRRAIRAGRARVDVALDRALDVASLLAVLAGLTAALTVDLARVAWRVGRGRG